MEDVHAAVNRFATAMTTKAAATTTTNTSTTIISH